jgi:hypothetical protein
MLAVLGRKNQHRATHTAADKPLTGSTTTRSNSHIKRERAAVQRCYRVQPCKRETCVTLRAKRGAGLAVLLFTSPHRRRFARRRHRGALADQNNCLPRHGS